MTKETKLFQESAQELAQVVENACRTLEELTGHKVELIRLNGPTSVTLSIEAAAGKGGAS